MLNVVSHGKGTIWGGGLQESQEDHSSGAERMTEGQVLTGLLIPLELGLLYEEGLGAIPTRCFDRIRIGDGTMDSQEHRQPQQKGTADALPGEFAPSR